MEVKDRYKLKEVMLGIIKKVGDADISKSEKAKKLTAFLQANEKNLIAEGPDFYLAAKNDIMSILKGLEDGD